MATLPDAKFNTLRALGYSGAISDMMLQFWNAGLSGGGPGPGPGNETFNLTNAGNNGAEVGYQVAFYGALDKKRTAASGRGIYAITTTGAGTLDVYMMDLDRTLADDYFESVDIPGITNGPLLTSAAAVSESGGTAISARKRWRWTGIGNIPNGMQIGQDYAVTLANVQTEENVQYIGEMVAANNGILRGFEIGVTGSPAGGSMTPAKAGPGDVWDWSRLATLAPGINRSDIALGPGTDIADTDADWKAIDIIGETSNYLQAQLRSTRNSAGLTEGYRYWIYNGLDLNFTAGETYSVCMRRAVKLYSAIMTAGAGASGRTGYYDGANNGIIGGPFGSQAPLDIPLSVPTTVAGTFHLSGFNEWDFTVVGNYGNAVDEFSFIRVTGITDPLFVIEIPASSMTRLFSSGETVWRFPTATAFVVGHDYTVEVFK